MNITAEGLELENIENSKIDKQTRGNVAPKGEELRDTTANDRRFDFWDEPINQIVSTAKGAR